MELPRRKADDVYLPDGTFRKTIEAFRQRRDWHDLRIVIAYAFDARTRMMPFWYVNDRMAPCSVRTLGDVLDACGFKHLRIVLQQWTPNFKPSRAILDGRPPDILMVSAMQVHGEPSFDLVRDAHRLGSARPLILTGGPKAIYEPTDYFDLGPQPGVGADCVVTGEVFVMLDLLKTILEGRRPGESVRQSFDRARTDGDLENTPGLVYLSPQSSPEQPFAVNTGVQQLLRDLDELPIPDAGYRMLEPQHKGQSLARKPCSAKKAGRISIISSVIVTHGCKFNCDYCPIPAVNQRTWRHKSPQRLADEIAHVHETFGIQEFFSTDDNFFNDRQTVIDLFTELASRKLANGAPLGERIRFYTEATEFDVHKNLDILPLCRQGGMRAIWFGIEDITAELINKGQNEGKTADLFKFMHKIGIEPMAMMMHSDGQPYRTSKGDLGGLANQARYLFDKGAVSYQCTYLAPAVGTRSIEPMARGGMLYKNVDGKRVSHAYLDGNHVVASKSDKPWERQLNVLRAYAVFYNPINTLKVLARWRSSSLSTKRLLFQFIGQVGLIITAPKMWRWAQQLKKGPIEPWPGLIQAPIPMVDAHTGYELNWGIERLPSSYLPQAPADGPPSRTDRSDAVKAKPAAPSNGFGRRIGLPIFEPQRIE